MVGDVHLEQGRIIVCDQACVPDVILREVHHNLAAPGKNEGIDVTVSDDHGL